MASKTAQLAAAAMSANYTTPDDDAIDFGAFRTVGVQRRALKTQAGNANLVVLRHRATKESAWVDTTVGFKLDGSDSDFQELPSFLRYIGVKAPGSADGSAVFAFDLIAKE